MVEGTIVDIDASLSQVEMWVRRRNAYDSLIQVSWKKLIRHG